MLPVSSIKHVHIIMDLLEFILSDDREETAHHASSDRKPLALAAQVPCLKVFQLGKLLFGASHCQGKKERKKYEVVQKSRTSYKPGDSW